MIRFATAAAACALTCSFTPAFAASQAVATLGGLNFRLIDLNPQDGISPSFSFLSSAGSTLMTVNASDNALGEAESASRKRAGTFSFSGQMLADLANADASAKVGPTALEARGAASGAQTSFNASASAGAVGGSNVYYPSFLPLNLSLSANSLLLIEADVTLKASATNPGLCTEYYYYCNHYGLSGESANASASMQLSYSYSSNGTSAIVNDNRTVSLQANAQPSYTTYTWEYDPYTGYYGPVYRTVGGADDVKSLATTLRTVFTNSTDLAQMGSLGFSVAVSGTASTVAVPEPESYALALAGLSMVALLSRRRRQS